MKNITNMGSLRVCVLLLVTLVQFQRIAGKPLFGELFGDYLCDYLCDDDDDVSTTTSTSREDADWDVFGMCTCGTRRPPGTRRRGQGIPANINMRLPPSANGMNFSMTNTNGAWSFQLDANPNNPIGGPIGSFPGGAGVIPIGGPTTFTPIVGGASTVVATTATTAKP